MGRSLCTLAGFRADDARTWRRISGFGGKRARRIAVAADRKMAAGAARCVILAVVNAKVRAMAIVLVLAAICAMVAGGFDLYPLPPMSAARISSTNADHRFAGALYQFRQALRQAGLCSCWMVPKPAKTLNTRLLRARRISIGRRIWMRPFWRLHRAASTSRPAAASIGKACETTPTAKAVNAITRCANCRAVRWTGDLFHAHPEQCDGDGHQPG